jgi:hypothetical protein
VVGYAPYQLIDSAREYDLSDNLLCLSLKVQYILHFKDLSNVYFVYLHLFAENSRSGLLKYAFSLCGNQYVVDGYQGSGTGSSPQFKL